MMIKLITVVFLLITTHAAFAKSWTCTNAAGGKAVFSDLKSGEPIADVYVDLQIANFEMKHVQFERVRNENTDFFHRPVEKRDEDESVNMRMNASRQKLEIFKNGSLVGTLDSCRPLRATPKSRDTKEAAL